MRIATNPKLTLTIGLATMALAFVIERFLPDNPGLNFIVGFLFAMSIAFNIKYLMGYRRTQKP